MKVRNMPKGYTDYKYIVVRDCMQEVGPYRGYWYYGGYDDLTFASQVSREIGNGLLVEPKDIEPIY